MKFKAYPFILQGHEATIEQATLAALDGIVILDSSCEGMSEFSTPYTDWVDTLNGFDIWYDYAADYYFFTDNEAN